MSNYIYLFLLCFLVIRSDGIVDSYEDEEEDEISLEFIEKLDAVKCWDEVEKLTQNWNEPEVGILRSRNDLQYSGSSYSIGINRDQGLDPERLKQARHNTEMATNRTLIACKPNLVLVSLRNEIDINNTKNIYMPECMQIRRCSGCCRHKKLSCQPTETESVDYAYNVSESFKKWKTKIVTLEEHTKCSCQCKIKESDCTPFQKYNIKKCACECSADNIIKCNEKHNQEPLFIWNPDTCSCQCKPKECSTNLVLNKSTCKCEPETNNDEKTQPAIFNDRFKYKVRPSVLP